MKKNIFTTVLVIFYALTTVAQIGIGTSSPNANAALEVASTSQGILFPRMTTAQRDAVSSPAKGLTIYNTTLNFIQTNTGTSGTPNWKIWDGINPSTNGMGAVSGYLCTTASTGTLTEGVAVSGITQTITATVTTVGTYSISTTANGVTFAASGTFAATGSQNIVLTATGTPTASGTHTFTLNTTPGCSFDRTTFTPLPGDVTLSEIKPYFVVSVYDQDYLPYSAPTTAASLSTLVAANGVNESTVLDIQGTLTTTGVTIKIPYTVVTASVNLPAYSQTITIPASYTQDGISRDVNFSYAAATYGEGSGNVPATLKAVDGALNIKKLDMQTGIGNDVLGFLLAQFTYVRNSVGDMATFDFRAIAAIPDRNIANANHVMFYLPVLGADGKTWLNNNLGADYSNTANTSFNPAQQATVYNDFHAYGSLFQWGRYSDGHELINFTSSSTGTAVNGSTTDLSSTDDPGHGLFILTDRSDWRSPQNDNLWQGVNGINNPCPYGFRLPTQIELDAQRLTWVSNNYEGAFLSQLKLPIPGSRNVTTGSNFNIEIIGYYWSSSVFDIIYARFLNFFNTDSSLIRSIRSSSFSVRCIKD